MRLHRRHEAFETLFALTSSHDFTDAWHEDVHRGDGLTVVVLAHVERLRGFRVVVDGHRALEMLLGEITFVLGLQVLAPDDGILEFTTRLQQELHGLGIRDARKGSFGDESQPLEQAFIDVSIKKIEFIRTLFQGRLY